MVNINFQHQFASIFTFIAGVMAPQRAGADQMNRRITVVLKSPFLKHALGFSNTGLGHSAGFLRGVKPCEGLAVSGLIPICEGGADFVSICGRVSIHIFDQDLVLSHLF